MNKETLERLIMENNRAINGLTAQAIYFVGTDQYFTIIMEIRQLQKEQKRLEKLLKQHQQYNISGKCIEQD